MADSPATWLVIPTYNEAANVEAIGAAALAELPEPRRLLIVDDDSPDGTGAIADRIRAREPDVEVLHRPRKHAIGYAFQVEMTYRAIQAGFRVIEVPITFRDRRVGESKMTGRIVLEAAWRVPAMRLRQP